jgi:hypothetical protein
MLQGPDAIRAATILEDCVDQLCVLGRIMPTSFDSRIDAVEVIKTLRNVWNTVK